ncbi:hypothetical protein [Mycobacterium sp. shizuoka-1]|uniref:hypothetical protein n=1 Tax=Mycobacterium sp. shizuoka-1 TaxID=2039281 RepID=UPI000C060661|nr:hypothetical protein [Mycobacterium sp. shizuoka-1]GAY16241.1 hypothetical protein MSZK_29670 [Mycobacterium sp. shizuoka-1]
MSKPEGIYLSVDYRITNVHTRNCLDDTRVKHLRVDYPPENGPKALFAHTGVAELADGTPIGDWLRETIRGETDVINVSMQHVKSRLDRDLARYLYKYHASLIIIVLVIEGNKRFLGGFHNFKADLTVARQFTYEMTELTEPGWWAYGSVHQRVADDYGDKLTAALAVRPRRPQSHMKLLASVNRRVADETVSPYCHVAFIPASDYFTTGDNSGRGPQSQTFVEPGESVPFKMPSVINGIDLSFQMELFVENAQEQFKLMKEGKAPGPNPLSLMSPDEINRHLQRRP